jgi:glycosyltransferase involved in cell wall biosynthesis
VQPIPWIAHVHGWLGPTQTGKWRLYETLDRRFVRAANLVLVGSCAAKKDVEAAGVRSVTVLPNAIEIPPIGALSDGAAEVRSMLRIDSNAVTVGIVGRVHPGKGHRFLLQAIAKLRKEGLNVEGIVVGEGPDLENLRSNARESGIAQVVHFPGFCSDAAPYVNAMDIFVAPSLKESMPLTVLEAMAARRAVVASRVGDIPSVLEHGYDGWLVTPGDSDDLTDAIKVLVRDPALRARMGERARRKIEEQFSAETMSRRLEEIYASLLGKKVQTA